MKQVLAFLALLCWASVASSKVPVLRTPDPRSLDKVISFGPPDPKLGKTRGEIFWRIDVDLPRHTSIKRVQIPGYAPVILELNDGRCFQIDMESGGSKLTSDRIGKVDCPPEQKEESPWTAPILRPGMTYVGRGWDLDAWTDRKSGITSIFQAKHQDAPPMLTTNMRVLALGGLGGPDFPATEVTLVGYVGRQLTLATVMLYYP